MSLPKFLYTAYKGIRDCALVRTKVVNEENLNEFSMWLNRSEPSKLLEDGSVNKDYQKDVAAHNFVRFVLVRGNEENFARYVSSHTNSVNGLILWTGTRHIIKYFDLWKLVHIRWDKNQNKYIVTPFESQQDRIEKGEIKASGGKKTYKAVAREVLNGTKNIIKDKRSKGKNIKNDLNEQKSNDEVTDETLASIANRPRSDFNETN